MTTLTSVPPLSIKDCDIGDPGITPYLMCNVVTKATSTSKLEGIQKINGVWRIYLKDKVTRLELFHKNHLLTGTKHVLLYDQNPNQSRYQMINGQHNAPLNNEKLTIKNIPLSVSNDEIKRMLEENGVTLRSAIKYGCIRDSSGYLTSYKSGDRFVYVRPFDTPLSRSQKVGNFSCIVIHHGKETPCVVCGESGHKVGDLGCKALPTETIRAFKGFRHPLSNHFPCRLQVYESEFKSVEHAYFWQMATEFGNSDLATEIQNSAHAGEVKKLSKLIAEDDKRFTWETDNIDVMKFLLQAKAKQCTQFRNCLIENKGKTLAEATPSKLWASGFSPFVTEHSSPQFWTGQNMLGVLLMELTETLLSKNQDEPTIPASHDHYDEHIAPPQDRKDDAPMTGQEEHSVSAVSCAVADPLSIWRL